MNQQRAMANAVNYPIEGGCSCRHVRYRLESRPLFFHCCHCRWCQRESGSSFALNAMIEGDRVTQLAQSPELVNTPTASGRDQLIARCPACRVAVWSNYASAGPLIKFVRVGTLDNPDRRIFISSPPLSSRGSPCRRTRQRWKSTTTGSSTGLQKAWRGERCCFRLLRPTRLRTSVKPEPCLAMPLPTTDQRPASNLGV